MTGADEAHYLGTCKQAVRCCGVQDGSGHARYSPYGARLGEVRVINHQTGIVRLVVTADDDFSPKLADNMVHQLAPVGTAIVEELIEHIFTTTKFAA